MEFEFRIRRGSDGAGRWLVSLSRLVRDSAGHPCSILGVNFDITEWRQAEQDLRHATALLRAIGDCSPDPIFAKDTEGCLIFANPAIVDIVGKPVAAIIGLTDAEWHPDPEQAAAMMANDRCIIETGRAGIFEETVDVAGRGRRIFRSAKAPLRMSDGSVIGVAAVASDITEIKGTEAALRHLTAHLETRVQEEVAARESAQARAARAERVQALGLLAGGIAHDFNNVLQTVAGAGAMIREHPDDTASVRRFAARLLEASERGASITRRLLTFGRRADLHAAPLDAASLLHGLREILAHTLGAGIAVAVSPEAGLPPLLADKAQLETALINLATNARDAMPEGGRLTFSAAAETVPADGSPPKVGLQAGTGLQAGRYVRLTVTDTGVGMAAATLARAGEPFFTTKPPGTGTGLGLAMVRGFTEQSGGAMSLESTPGKGTIVTLWLPEAVAGAPSAAAALPFPAAPAESGTDAASLPVRVMLVDDEEMVLEVMAAFLEDSGFRVLVAANGAEALALLAAEEAVDVLITDLSMPGMDGIAVIRAAQARHPGLPAVLLTGYAGDDAALANRDIAGGAYSLLRKPVGGAELVGCLRALARERNAAG